MTPVGFPHSDIHGSLPAFGFPWLFVDRYVLLRLPVPRHPPCALLSLTSLCLFDPALQSRSNHFFGFSLAIPSHLVAQCAGIFFSHIHTFLYLCALLHILSFLLYSVFKVRLLGSHVSVFAGGGLKWTRTIDLTLIRRALYPPEL